MANIIEAIAITNISIINIDFLFLKLNNTAITTKCININIDIIELIAVNKKNNVIIIPKYK